MTSQSFQHAVSHVLRMEGGYVHNPVDPGGATNFGVTQRYLDTARAKYPDLNLPTAVEQLTSAQVQELYRRNEWTDIQGESLPAPIALALLDFAVNSGVTEAVKSLQHAFGLTVDGIMGPMTAAAASRPEAVTALSTERILFLSKLQTWPTFGKGWTTRVIDTAIEAFQ